MPDLITTAQAVSLILQREDARRGLGWTAAAILSPVILLAALLCCLAAGAEYNAATADLCFLGGPMPEGADSAYIQNITDMRESFARLDEALEQVQGLTASGSGLDAISVKAAFFVLCFGGPDLPPTAEEAEAFVDCFLRYETTTEVQWDEDGSAVLVEVVTAVPLPLSGAYAALEEAGYLIDEETETAIREVYLRYAYHGGGFSGEILYGSGGDAALSIDHFTDPDTKNAGDLAAYAVHAWEAQWGYVWGTFGQVLTESLLQQKCRQYPNGVADKEDIIREKWLGGRTVDCVGLIKSYGWLDPETMTIRYETNGMPDIGADAMYYRAQVKGGISTIPEVPGLAVWHSGHIGVYIGDGEVIEAMGTVYGVVKTRLDERGWTHWLEIPYINYE